MLTNLADSVNAFASEFLLQDVNVIKARFKNSENTLISELENMPEMLDGKINEVKIHVDKMKKIHAHFVNK